MSKKKIIAAGLVIFTVVLLGILIVVNNRPKAMVKLSKDVPVEVAALAKGDIAKKFEFTGTIQANAQIAVTPKGTGRIERILVDEGDQVTANQLLATLEHTELSLQVSKANEEVKSALAGLNKAKSMSKISAVSSTTQAKAALEALMAKYNQLKTGARPEEIEQVKAALDSTKIALDNAQRNAERMEKLYNTGSISKSQYEAAQDNLGLAEANYKAAQERLKVTQNFARKEDLQAMEAQIRQAQAQVQIAETSERTKGWSDDITMAQTRYQQAVDSLALDQTSLDNANIRTMISGVVTKKFYDVGAMASPGVPLFTVMDTSSLKILVNLAEDDMVNLRVGQSADVKISAIPDKVFEGKIVKISPVVDEKTRKCSMEVKIENPNGELKPGMFARGSIVVQKVINVLNVPREAVVNDNGTDYIYVIKDNKAAKIQVQKGLGDAKNIEVQGNITEGDQVVTVGWDGLKEGTPVQIVQGGI